jgi:hypothetical protein
VFGIDVGLDVGGVFGGEDIYEELAVCIALQEVWEFGAEPFFEAVGERLVSGLIEAVEDESAEEDLAAGIFGAFLFREAGLEGFFLRVEFGETLFDGSAGHGDILCGGVCGRGRFWQGPFP